MSPVVSDDLIEAEIIEEESPQKKAEAAETLRKNLDKFKAMCEGNKIKTAATRTNDKPPAKNINNPWGP
jgi:hypothetical protein